MNNERIETPQLSAETKIGFMFELYRRRATAQLIAQAILWLGVVVAVLSVLFFFALGWWGGNDIRITGFLLWLVVVGAVIVSSLLLPLKHLRSPAYIAKKIGSAVPKHRSAIISADQFVRAPRISDFSSLMLEKHLEQTLEIFAQISPKQVLPLSKLYLPMSAFGVAMIAIYLFGSFYQPVIEAGLSSLFFDREVPEQTVLQERLNPVVSDLSLRLKYPEYLKKKERQLSSFSGGIEAPLGTTAILEATPIETDVSQGRIELSDGSFKELNFLPDGRVVGKFLIDDIDWFSLSLGSERHMIRGPRRTVHVEKDQNPTIRLLRPVQDLEIDADGDVLVEFEAHDDHGIGRIDLIIRSTKDVNIQKTITHAAPNVTHIRNDHRWSVGSIKLEDVHEVELLVRVYDDDTIRGPKYSNSNPVQVKIMTPKSRQQELIIRQGKILDSLVDLLAHRLSTPVPVSRDKADETRERYLKLRGETEDVTSAIAKLLRRLEKESNASTMLKETYRQIRQDLTNQILFEARLNGSKLAPFKKRDGVDSVTVRLLEKSIAQIDDLILDMQFYTMSESGKLLEQQRNDLSELLKIYHKHRSERSRRSILEAVERMQRTAQYLAEKMSKVRGQVSATSVNQAMNQTFRLDQYFTEMKRLLGEGDIEQALKLSQKLEQTVAQLMAGLEGGHLAFKNERFGRHNEFVEKLLEKLTHAEAQQLQLRRKTIGVQRQYKEKVLHMMRGEIDGLVRTQSQTVKKLRASIENIRGRSSLPSTKLIVQLRELTKRMDEVLKQGDLDRTMEIAREIKYRVSVAKGAVVADKTYADLKFIEKLSQNIVTKISDSFPNPARVFNDQDKRVIRTATIKQRRIASDTRKISSWVTDQKRDFQFLGTQTQYALQTVMRHMRAGTASLEKRELHQAAQNQTRALDELSKLRQSLKNTGTAVVETTTTGERREVFIPDPKDYKVPKKHREDILEAMRAQLPEHYEEAIKKYYETLVR